MRLNIRISRLRLLTALIFLGLAAIAHAGASIPSQPFADAEAGVLYDSNVGHGELPQDVKSDLALTVAFSGGRFVVLDAPASTSLSVSADLAGQLFDRFHGMSNLVAGGTASLQRKFGLGPGAPWLNLTMSASHLSFANTVRNGWLYQPSFGAGRRIGERWELRGDYTIDYRTADHVIPSDPDRPGDVFDQKTRSLTIDLRFSATDNTVLSTGYTRTTGDVAVTTSAPTDSIDQISSAETYDTVFGADSIAYKLQATSHIWFVRMSRSLGGHAVAGLSFRREWTYAAGNNDYYSTVLTATCLYSF